MGRVRRNIMDYEISINVREGSPADRNIMSVSKSEHVSREEAVLRLIAGTLDVQDTPAALIARVRANKVHRRSADRPMSEPAGNAKRLIGFLADEPDIAEAIRTLARERRTQAYGI